MGNGAYAFEHRQSALQFDPNVLRTYLETLLPIVMSASHRSLASTLFASNWKEPLVTFALDPSSLVLYINKTRSDDVRENVDDEGELVLASKRTRADCCSKHPLTIHSPCSHCIPRSTFPA